MVYNVVKVGTWFPDMQGPQPVQNANPPGKKNALTAFPPTARYKVKKKTSYGERENQLR